MTRAHASIARKAVAEYDSVETTPALERLLALRRIRPATLRLVDLGYPPSAPYDIAVSDALNDQRSES